MLNPFAAVSWLWRAWRGKSLTFAALFAFGVLGISVMSLLRQGLREVGAPWYLWLVIPFVGITLLARKEAAWVPDPAERRKWALRIVVGSIVLSIAGVNLNFWQKPEPEPAAPAVWQGGGRADPHGR